MFCLHAHRDRYVVCLAVHLEVEAEVVLEDEGALTRVVGAAGVEVGAEEAVEGVVAVVA